MGEGEQRTAEWHAERDKRLTASAFGNALGYATSVHWQPVANRRGKLIM